MKSRSIIFSLVVLIIFGLNSGTFAQNKPPEKTKTLNKTEKVMKDNTKSVKSVSHKAVMRTTNKQDMKKVRMKNEKMTLSQNMTKISGKEGIAKKEKEHTKLKLGKDKSNKKNDSKLK